MPKAAAPAWTVALQVSWRTERQGAPGADDEYPQWRRTFDARSIFRSHGHAGKVRHLREALRAGTEIFHALKGVLKKRGLSTAIGDEGGFAPKLQDADDALETIADAVKDAGYKLGKEVFIALDVASSEFYDADKKVYVFKKSDGSKRTAEELVSYYQGLAKKFPVVRH